MRCHPCVRGCGMCKVFVGLGCVAVGIWFMADPVEILDCAKLSNECPNSFSDLIQEMNAGDHTVNPLTGAALEAEVDQYCECLVSCVNYFTVYEDEQDKPEPTNCFLYSKNAGIVSGDNNNRRLLEASELLEEVAGADLLPWAPAQTAASLGRRLGDGGSLPGLSRDECITCSQIDEHEENFFYGLGGVAIGAGLALLITAGCEHMELKMNNPCFGACVLITDLVAGLFLSGAALTALVGLALASAGCDPENLKKAIDDAGADSTDGGGGTDNSAAFARFLYGLLYPMAEGLCATKPRFILFHICTDIGMTASFWSFFAMLCICCGLSEDGDGGRYDDARAAELQQMMRY